MCDVYEIPERHFLVKTLVGGPYIQSAEMFDIGTDLYVVEIIFCYRRVYAGAPTVPRYLEIWIFFVQVAGKGVHVLRLRVSTHETHTSYVVSVFTHHTVEHKRCERFPDIIPQILTVASRTMTRTMGDVYGKGHFIGYLLKDDTRIYIFQHETMFSDFTLTSYNACVLSLLDVLRKNCSHVSGSLLSLSCNLRSCCGSVGIL